MKKIQIMLLALLVFGAMFGTMFVLGYDSARSDAAKDPHYTEKVAFTKVKVARDNDKYLYHFVYKRGEKVLYMYDVDTNELISGDRLLEAWRTKLTTTDRDWLIVLDPSLSAAIGGVTFGIGVKDLILDPILLKQIWKLRQNNQWHVLAAVIGAIGGYGAGYAFAVHRSVPTEQILRLLSDPQRWHDKEGMLFANEVEYLEGLASDIDNKGKRLECQRLLEKATERVRGTVHKTRSTTALEVTSADLRLLSEAAETIKEGLKTNGRSLWFWLAAAVVGVVLMMLVAFVVVALIELFAWGRRRGFHRIVERGN